MKKTTLILAVLFSLSPVLAQHEIALVATNIKPSLQSSVKNTAFTQLNIQVVDDLLLLEGNVDGQSGYFILDTGSPMLVLHGKPDKKSKETINTVTGFTEGSMMMVKKLQVGNMEFQQLSAIKLPLHQFCDRFDKPFLGLLGMGVFDGYELFFDVSNKQILLFADGKNNRLHQYATPVASISFTMEMHLAVIPVKAQGKEMFLALDSGAGSNILCTSKTGSLQNISIPLGEIELRGVNGSIEITNQAAIHSLQIQNTDLEVMKFVFADMAQVNKTTSKPLDGLLGYPFFSGRKLSLNYREKALYLW